MYLNMGKLPKRCGISLNPGHYKEILDAQPKIAWLEVTPEYYLGLGGAPHYYLEKLSSLYPIGLSSSLLSIGSAESVDEATLNDLRRLVELYQPSAFTELLSWTRWQGTYYKTPMPLPYTEETLDQVSLNIKTVQNGLGRRILIENPAQFMTLSPQDFSEGEFFHELVRATGCGVALNVSNLYISSVNFDKDPFKALATYPLAAVQQLRLTGQQPLPLNSQQLIMIDASNGEITKPIWSLYQALVRELPGPVTVSIDWREESNSLERLMDLAEQADDAQFEIHPMAANKPEPKATQDDAKKEAQENNFKGIES